MVGTIARRGDGHRGGKEAATVPVATNHGPGGRPPARGACQGRGSSGRWRPRDGGPRRLAGRRLADLVADERALPAFLILGAQRGGTTSLFRWLAQHPQVARPLEKEVQFFTLEWSRGLDWYRRHFPPATEGQVTFEASPYYLYHPLAPGRVAAVLPAAKLVAVLREPVARSRSHFEHNRRLGLEDLSFPEAIAAEPARLAGEERRLLADPSAVSHGHRHHSYLDRGRYHRQLARWDAACPGRLLVLESEHLFRHPHDAFQRLLAFLELDPWRPPSYDNGSRHPAGASAAVPDTPRRRAPRRSSPATVARCRHGLTSTSADGPHDPFLAPLTWPSNKWACSPM